MSGIFGLDDLRQKLTTFELLTRQGVESMLRDEVAACQKEAADLAPVRSGRLREALLMKDAIKQGRSSATGGLQLTFGFITTAQKKMAYYGFWIEFGTKARSAGELLRPQRRDRRSKSGRLTKKILRKKAVPARQAQPFFRPAVANLILRLKRARQFSTIVAAAKAGAGLADRS